MDYDYPMWVWVLYWIFMIINIVSIWKLFMKANKPGWASIIPIYNTIVFIQIAKKPVWWIILLFIPIVNLVIGVIVSYDFFKAYGKGLGYFIGAAFLPFIFYPMLAFGDAQYLYKEKVDMNPDLGNDDTSQPPTENNPIDPTQNTTI